MRVLERYLVSERLISDGAQTKTSSFASILLEEYASYLHEVRGLAMSTISDRQYIARCFLKFMDEEGVRLKNIRTTHIEAYIKKKGKHLRRISLRVYISSLRVFLRFLTVARRVPDGVATQIDTPRVYRMEQLPRALQWDTIRALLTAIDRTSGKGLRDYAMFLLIITYGLPACF